MKFRCSESETLFVFTVITRSQNIGRPLLKRFPSCAIVFVYYKQQYVPINIHIYRVAAATFGSSQFAKHTGNFSFTSSQAFLLYTYTMHTNARKNTWCVNNSYLRRYVMYTIYINIEFHFLQLVVKKYILVDFE